MPPIIRCFVPLYLFPIWLQAVVNIGLPRCSVNEPVVSVSLPIKHYFMYVVLPLV